MPAVSTPTLHVDSEVGRSGGCCCTGPTSSCGSPSNCADLLFDNVLWVSGPARSTTPSRTPWARPGRRSPLCGRVAGQGTVKDDDARRWVLDRMITDADLDRDLAVPVRAFFDEADPATVATHLIEVRRRAASGHCPGPGDGRGRRQRVCVAATAQPPVHPRPPPAGYMGAFRSIHGNGGSAPRDRSPRGHLPVPSAVRRRTFRALVRRCRQRRGHSHDRGRRRPRDRPGRRPGGDG